MMTMSLGLGRPSRSKMRFNNHFVGCLIPVVVVAVALTQVQVHGFVCPKVITFATSRGVQQLPPTPTAATPKSTVALHAADDGITMVKQGLKWILVPNAKKPYIPEAPVTTTTEDVVSTAETSTASESTVASSASSSASTPLTTTTTPPTETVQEAVVSTAAKAVPTAPSESVVSTPPPETVVQTTAQLNEGTVTASSIPSGDPNAVPGTTTTTLLQIVPQTDDMGASSTASTMTTTTTTSSTPPLDFDQFVQAVRENHWARMPQIIQETPSTGSSTAKAPLLIDILEQNGEQYEKGTQELLKQEGSQLGLLMGRMAHSTQIGMQESSEKAAEALREAAKVTEAYLRESGRLVQESVATTNQFVQEKSKVMTVAVDPTVYNELRDKIAASADGQSLSVEEMNQAFQLKQFSLDPITLAVTSSWYDFIGSLAAVKEVLGQEGGVTSDDIVNAMNLKETGTWYFATAFVLVLMTLSSFGSSEGGGTSKDQQIITTDAALPFEDTTTEEAAASLVSEEVNKLKEATNAMYAQLNQIKTEKSTRVYELATLKSELRDVTNRLEMNILEERQLRYGLEAAQEKLEKETVSLKEQLQERVEAEDQLREELAAAQKQLSNEARKVTRAKNKSEKEVLAAEEKVQKLEAEKGEIEKELIAMRNEVDSLKQRLANSKSEQEDDDDEEEVVEKEPELVVSKPKKTRGRKVNGSSSSAVNGSSEINGVNGVNDSSDTVHVNGSSSVEQEIMERSSNTATLTDVKPKSSRETRGKKNSSSSAATTKLPSTAYDDLSESFFASIVDPVQPVSNPPPGVKTAKKASSSSSAAATESSPSRKQSARKIVVKKVPSAATKRGTSDWSQLSESTLKRKTIKELSEYLEMRGAATVGSDGKTLKKDALVQTVLSQ